MFWGVSTICSVDDRVSVIIPTLNEEASIREVLSAIPRQVVDEVIVVDGSSDMTGKIAEELGAKVIYEPRKGYGRAIQTAIENSLGEIVVYIDGDSTYDPSEITKLIEPVRNGKLDVVLGNRLEEPQKRACMHFVNRIGNRVLSAIFQLIFGVRVSDTQCGLRAVRRSAVLDHRCRNFGMAYVTEQLAGLVKLGYRVGEVPVSYGPRIGRSKLNRLRDGLSILSTMLREKCVA
jgi:glycosyltransferase involved in cell wall biosynthesis